MVFMKSRNNVFIAPSIYFFLVSYNGRVIDWKKSCVTRESLASLKRKQL